MSPRPCYEVRCLFTLQSECALQYALVIPSINIVSNRAETQQPRLYFVARRASRSQTIAPVIPGVGRCPHSDRDHFFKPCMLTLETIVRYNA